MEHSNTLVARQTLYKLTASVNDASFALQVSATKLYGLLSWDGIPVPDVIFTEVGERLAEVRQSVSNLETFVLTLSS